MIVILIVTHLNGASEFVKAVLIVLPCFLAEKD